MGKELRIYRIVDNVMRYSNYSVSYIDAYNAAKDFCCRHKKPLFDVTHVGDTQIAKNITTELTGVKIW